jgi:hypothetical protein
LFLERQIILYKAFTAYRFLASFKRLQMFWRSWF